MAHPDPSSAWLAGVLAIILPALWGCAPEPQGARADWRKETIPGCCTVRLPPELVPPTEPAGMVSETRSFVRPGLSISFEYASDTLFPRRRTVQQGWEQGEIRIDGRGGDIISYDAGDSQPEGGRIILVRVPLQGRPAVSAGPASRSGKEFGATIHCVSTSDCGTAIQIVRTTEFLPSRD